MNNLSDGFKADRFHPVTPYQNCPQAVAPARYLLLGLFVALLHVFVGGARGDTIDRFVRTEMERQRIPGLALAVLQHGKMVKAADYGMANVEHAVPVIPETVFQSASVGKQLRIRICF